MNSFLFGIQFVFRIIWELPQCLLGILLLPFFKCFGQLISFEFEKNYIIIKTHKVGLSLGVFVFCYSEENRKHEYGHSIQSLLLGWLYLIVVGLPSIIRASYYSIKISRVKKGGYQHLCLARKYKQGYPENWVESLGKNYIRRLL